MAQEEEARLAVEQAKKKSDQEVKELKKDIDELEIAISKVITNQRISFLKIMLNYYAWHSAF